MATTITKVGTVPYKSPGVYFRTIDLTVVTQQTGTFSAAGIGLMERGPAFEVGISNTYQQRAFKYGELNPDYLTSYYAKQYLEQSDNYKEVRILGLEGYKDNIAYVIAGTQGSSAFDNSDPDNVQATVVGQGQLYAILKLRPTYITGLPPVTSVIVDSIITTNPNTGLEFDRATDYLFKLTVSFDQSSGSVAPLEFVASLRADSNDYLVKKLGTDPLKTPKINNSVSPLWVDFIIPTEKQRPYSYVTNSFMPIGYYGGNGLPTDGYIDLLQGDVRVSTQTTVNSVEVWDVTFNSTSTIITVEGNVTSWLTDGNGVLFNGIKDSGYGNMSFLNTAFLAHNISTTTFTPETSSTALPATVFTISDLITDQPITSADFQQNSQLMIPAVIKDNGWTAGTAPVLIDDIVFSAVKTTVKLQGDYTSTNTDSNPEFTAGDIVMLSNVDGASQLNNTNFKAGPVTVATGVTSIDLLYDGGSDDGENVVLTDVQFLKTNPTTSKFILPTWEAEFLDFSNTQFQTPVTPWFVSDIDNSGDYKRLFRLWSISDGKSANSEIKTEVININPGANNGKGSFDILIRIWSDKDDQTQSRLETFSNLTMDASSSNYILRRIGNGEDFPVQSQYVFVEINEEEEIEANRLPWGCLGYPTANSQKTYQVPWTVDFDKTKVIGKQTLGLPNNAINMNRSISPDMFAYISRPDTVGKGFHLNPRGLQLDATGALLADFANATELSDTFTFCTPTRYYDISGKTVTGAAAIARNKYCVSFYGGFDGWNVYSQRTWDDTTSPDYKALTMAVDILSDNELLDTDFTVLTTPDLSLDLTPNACAYVYEMVSNRGDAMYIPDIAYEQTVDVVGAVDKVVNSSLRSAQVAVYYPWLQISDIINNLNVWTPPSILALGTIAYTANNLQVWQPPGGYIKTITNNLVRARGRLKLNDREQLLAANINPIASFAGTGYEICGVRTTQEQFSALSFIHNTLLLCYAKKALNQTLRALLFTMNNQTAQDAFIATITPIFDRIKKLNGLDSYNIVVYPQDANDPTTLHAAIEIVPLYPLERIIVDFTLTNGSLAINSQ